jgi:hypothetical protein
MHTSDWKWHLKKILAALHWSHWDTKLENELVRKWDEAIFKSRITTTTLIEINACIFKPGARDLEPKECWNYWYKKIWSWTITDLQYCEAGLPREGEFFRITGVGVVSVFEEPPLEHFDRLLGQVAPASAVGLLTVGGGDGRLGWQVGRWQWQVQGVVSAGEAVFRVESLTCCNTQKTPL